VLINMNKDSVEASMHQLHEGTVGQLNADFDSSVEPYRKLVQTLQARTTGQIDSGGGGVDPPRRSPVPTAGHSGRPSCRRPRRAPTP